AAVLIVYGAIALEGRWRVPGWLLRCGDASYSLYLLHPALYMAAFVIGVRLPHGRLSHRLWLLGTLAATLAVGFLFHRLVERPLLDLVKSRRKPRPEPAAAAGSDP